jgi:hypothetical protein
MTIGPDAQGSFLVGGGTYTNRSNFANNSSFFVTFTNTAIVWDPTGSSALLTANSNSIFFTATQVLELSQNIQIRAFSTHTNWFQGALTGSTKLRLTGGGNTIFSGDNSGLSGAITNSASTLILKSANALGTGNYRITGDVTTRYEDIDQSYSQTFGLDSAATVHEVQSGRTVTLTGVAEGTGDL